MFMCETHRHSQIKPRRNSEEQDFAPACQLSRGDGPDRDCQQSQKRERRFDRDGKREVEPDSVGIRLAQQEGAVEVVHQANVRETVDVGLGEQMVARDGHQQLGLSRTRQLRDVVSRCRIQLQSSRTRRIAKSV